MSCLINDNHLLLFGRVWCEPVTVATDLLLAVQCLLLMRYHRRAAAGFFALSGVAFFFGGLRHLVVAEWGALVPLLSGLSNTANALSLTLLLVAMWGGVWLSRVSWAVGLMVVAAHLYADRFVTVILHTAVVFCGSLAVVVWRGRVRQDGWFVVGFVMSLLAGIIFATRLTPAFYFNHNDLAHVVLLGAHVALHRHLLSRPAGVGTG